MPSHVARRALLILVVSFGWLCIRSDFATPEPAKVRAPTVAGAFYPADPAELGKMVDEFLARATVTPIGGSLVALISPHAGYPYSGQVAAHSYALLKGRKFERVVVIAPSHLEAFPFSSIYDGDAFATPLGEIPVDKAFAAKLAARSPLIKISERGHGIVEGRGEHALEDELPFLQRTLGQFKLVPIIMGDQTYDSSRALGVALAKLIPGTDTLIVVSSDLSHYHPYDEAVRIDHQTLKAIEDWDYLSLSLNFERRIWEACGGGPIVAAMIAAERLGATRAVVLKYANSGDVTGDRKGVVGYGAVALVAEKTARARQEQTFTLSNKEKQELLKVARESVTTAINQQKLSAVPSGEPEALTRDRGAFVTLKKNGELRGCIGYITPIKSLVETVRDVAAFAALKDPRFPPVSAAEVGQLDYEISVLSPLRRVTDIKQIQVGHHGLLMRKGEREGVLLPQVPTEQGWDRKTFLEQTCRKAGLPPQAWQDEDTDIFMFTALVFSQPAAVHVVRDEEPNLPGERLRPGPPGLDLPRR